MFPSLKLISPSNLSKGHSGARTATAWRRRETAAQNRGRPEADPGDHHGPGEGEEGAGPGARQEGEGHGRAQRQAGGRAGRCGQAIQGHQGDSGKRQLSRPH
jgi:hypothetical protein